MLHADVFHIRHTICDRWYTKNTLHITDKDLFRMVEMSFHGKSGFCRLSTYRRVIKHNASTISRFITTNIKARQTRFRNLYVGPETQHLKSYPILFKI